MRLTIIIPAHNEEHRIGRMLDAYLPYFTDRYGDGVEFLVVVNGSTDRTDGVVADYARRYFSSAASSSRAGSARAAPS